MELSHKSFASFAQRNPVMEALFMDKRAIKYVALDVQQD